MGKRVKASGPLEKKIPLGRNRLVKYRVDGRYGRLWTDVVVRIELPTAQALGVSSATRLTGRSAKTGQDRSERIADRNLQATVGLDYR